LEELRRSGVKAWASRVAGRSNSGFETLAKRDPEFRAAVEEAIEEASGRIENEAVRRAVEGVEEPVVSAGALVKDDQGKVVTKRVYSDNLLAIILRARNNAYKTKQYHEVKHQYQTGAAYISTDDIMKLTESEQDQLLHLLGRIEVEKSGGDSSAQLAAEDAEFTEVEEGEELDPETEAELQSIL
jgi:hypothetical protein